jgi:hypothetical protein
MNTAADILREFGISPPPPGKTRYYTVCPKCSATRSREHQKTKVLGVSITDDGVTCGCNHCGWKGGRRFINGKDQTRPKINVAEFPYEDENGNTLFVVERLENPAILDEGKPKKTIKQKRPDPKYPGKWIWNIEGVPIVPYRLPQIMEAIADNHPIVIVEGEPKVDLLRSWNIAGTCNSQGALKWKPAHSEFLRGADVIICPDADDTGWQHANQVAESLDGIATRIRILLLPDAKPKDDVIDWAKRGGTREQFDALIDQAPDWTPVSASEQRNEEEKAKAKAREDALLNALIEAQGLDYERQKKAVAKELDVSPTAIDNEVKARREDMQAAPLYGHWITEPWLEVCDGDALLRDIIRRIKRHIVIKDEYALAIALWIVMSWVHDDIATHSPILNVNSAEPESGKSTLLTLVSLLMPKCISCVEISEAAIYRAIKKWQPSFCFDEFDTILTNDDKAALRSVINSGHRRGQGVLRCVGEDKDPELFPTFAPKAIGMVGKKLPAATLSRCIFVELYRRLDSEPVDELKDDDSDLANLRSRLRRWAFDSQDTLQNARPVMPDGLRNRKADNWKLQLAIADLCSSVVEAWGDKARDAAIKIETGSDSRTGNTRALAAIKAVHAKVKGEGISSADLIDKMAAEPDSEWAEWRNGKPISQKQLANLLKSFKIFPDQVRIDGHQIRGYLWTWFQDAWERYL